MKPELMKIYQESQKLNSNLSKIDIVVFNGKEYIEKASVIKGVQKIYSVLKEQIERDK